MTGTALAGVPVGLDVQRRANALLALGGWALTCVEIDTENGRLRAWARRDDGREVVLDARPGRATLTVEQAETRTVVYGRKGDRSPVERLSYRFLGRHVVGVGARSGLSGLARYLDDNSTGHRLARAAVAMLLPEAIP